jgi:hypothetical protein
MTRRITVVLCVAALALNLAGVSPSIAEEQGLKEDAKKAGRAVGSAAREVWQGAKKAGKEIGHTAAKAGKAVGGAAKEGAKELKSVFKGEK